MPVRIDQEEVSRYKDGAICIGWISPGDTSTVMMESTLNAVFNGMARKFEDPSATGIIEGFYSLQSGPRIVAARCDLVEGFLFDENAKDVQWLLMVDADMKFRPQDVEQLHATAAASLDTDDPKLIIGGLCFSASRTEKHMYPTIYGMEDNPDEPALPIFRRYEKYPKDALLKVAATGAAFLLVHRSVLVHMGSDHPYGFGSDQEGRKNPYPWFAEGVNWGTTSGAEYGEDIVFCLRATTLGYGIWVDTSVKIGHLRDQILDEEAYDDWLEKTTKLVKLDRAERRRQERKQSKAS